MTNLFDLSNKVAIVTGGNSGIGLGMGRGLAAAGAKVVIAARNETKSVAAVRELRGIGAEALAITCDVTNRDSVETLVRDTIARFRRINDPSRLQLLFPPPGRCEGEAGRPLGYRRFKSRRSANPGLRAAACTHCGESG